MVDTYQWLFGTIIAYVDGYLFVGWFDCVIKLL